MSEQSDAGTESAEPSQEWHCEDCDVTVPVYSSDPYYPDTVFCPECGKALEYEVIRHV